MKKAIAIILLGVHLFNLGGYHALFSFLQQKSSIQIIEQLDKGSYQSADLVEVKIPYPLPYAANWPNYERFDGEIDMNGMHYNYVKRRMLNDTLYLLCIPNHEKAKLAAAKKDYINSLNDQGNSSDGKKSTPSGIQKAFGSEYNEFLQNYCIASPIQQYLKLYSSNKSQLPDCFLSSPFQPPRA